MKLINFLMVIDQLTDAETTLRVLLKRPALPTLERENYQFQLKKISLYRAELRGLLDREHHWPIPCENRNKKELLCLEISDDSVVTELVKESQAQVDNLRKHKPFDELFSKFYKLRCTFMELVTTEHQFIDDYQKISKDKSHLCNAIDKFFSSKALVLVLLLDDYKKLLNTYDKAENFLAITFEESLRFADSIMYAVEWFYSKIFHTTDFMNFYEYKILPWSLAYSSLSELFNLVKRASEESKIQLSPEELSAVNHVVSRLSGAIQRLGRYLLLVKEISSATENLLTENCIDIPTTEQSPSIRMANILKFFSVKNLAVQGTIAAINYPTYLLDNLTGLISKLDSFVITPTDKQNSGFSLFSSSAPSPLEQGQKECVNTLTSELKKLRELFELELGRSSQAQGSLEIYVFTVYDFYSQKVREAIRSCFHDFVLKLPVNEYSKTKELPLYKLLDDYCQKIQPFTEEERVALTEQKSIRQSIRPM